MSLAIILAVVLAFSLFGNLTQFISNALTFNSGLHSEAFGPTRDAGPHLEEFVLENNKSQSKIAVITLDGIITSHDRNNGGNNMVDVIKAQLDRARDEARDCGRSQLAATEANQRPQAAHDLRRPLDLPRPPQLCSHPLQQRP